MSAADSEQPLGFLLFEVLRLLRRNFGRRVKLTQVQWRAMAFLSLNEGINQAGLADLLEVRPITLARLIDRMEESGLVERRRDSGDRRAVRLYLSRKAVPVMESMKIQNAETLKQALAGVSTAARTQLIETLITIKTNLLAAEPEEKLRR
jgi:DNA-binding MarR family transcriptional regulator